jgi:hypothetical protein
LCCVEHEYHDCQGKRSSQNANDAPLIIEPLTIAYLREPVIRTPKPILMHPTYNDGWKVLHHIRPDGSADLVMPHFLPSLFL